MIPTIEPIILHGIVQHPVFIDNRLDFFGLNDAAVNIFPQISDKTLVYTTNNKTYGDGYFSFKIMQDTIDYAHSILMRITHPDYKKIDIEANFQYIKNKLIYYRLPIK